MERELWPFLHCSSNRQRGHRWVHNVYVEELKAWYLVCELCCCHRFHMPAGGSALYSSAGDLEAYVITRSKIFFPLMLMSVLKKRLI